MKFLQTLIAAMVFAGIAYTSPNPNLYERAAPAVHGDGSSLQPSAMSSMEPAVVKPTGPSCPPVLRPFFTNCKMGPDCVSCLQNDIAACAVQPLTKEELIIEPQKALCDHCAKRAAYFVCTKEGAAEDAARKAAATQNQAAAQKQTSPAAN